MIAFPPDALPVSLASDLQPGQLFYRYTTSSNRLCLAMKGHADKAAWLELNGPDAFMMKEEDRPKQTRALPLPVPMGTLRLRVDFESAAFSFAEHRLGQLVYGHGKAPCIASTWERADDGYRNTVNLHTFEMDREHEPRFMFDRWALSYQDAGMGWVDVFTNSASGKISEALAS